MLFNEQFHLHLTYILPFRTLQKEYLKFSFQVHYSTHSSLDALTFKHYIFQIVVCKRDSIPLLSHTFKVESILKSVYLLNLMTLE